VLSPSSPTMSHWNPDWIIAAALLAVAAGWDVARHRIPNAIPVAVAVTGVLSAVWRSGAGAAAASVGALALVFAVLLAAWRGRLIGGGDLKLATGAAAWTGLGGLWSYALASGLALGAFAVVSYAASSRAARRDIRANLALAGRGAAAPVEIAAGGGRVPVPAGAAFALGAIGALLWGTR
jgi:prepilin peptidase CpaA